MKHLHTWLFNTFLLLTALCMISCGSVSSKDETAAAHTLIESAASIQNAQPETPAPKPVPTPAPPPERPLPLTQDIRGNGNTLDYYLDARLPEDVREAVLNNRATIFIDAAENAADRMLAWLTPGYDAEADEAVLQRMSTPTETKKTLLTREEAESEIRLLIDYLKYFYGGYQYFGGDEVFYPLRDDMLTALESYGETISTTLFTNKILYEYLSPVIVDCHFSLGGTSFSGIHGVNEFLLNESLVFERRADAFFIKMDGVEYELYAIDSRAPVDALLPVLDGEGRVVWAVGTLAQSKSPIQAELVLYNEASGETRTESITLTAQPTSPRFNDVPYRVNTTDDGIKVVTSRRCFERDAGYESPQYTGLLDKMAESAETLRDTPFIIVDLRSNIGGSDMYPMTWLRSLLGMEEYPNYALVSAGRITRTSYAFAHYNKRTSESEFFEWTGDVPGWEGPYVQEADKYINNNSLILVLTDAFVASSGETFVKMLRQTENVVVIGTQTAGMTSFGNCATVTLPVSGVSVYCGLSIFMEPDLSFNEGVGIIPDIWAPPAEALERAKAFIRQTFA